jgi:flagellar motor switch protein FliN/FliY
MSVEETKNSNEEEIEEQQNGTPEPVNVKAEPGTDKQEPVSDSSEAEKVNANLAVFSEFDESKVLDKSSSDKLQFFKDLQLNIYIELGRTQMQIKEILELERGYVIELDKQASEPVDIFVNNKKIAEGEVVVIDKHFGIRITNLNESSKDIKGLY